MVNLQKEATKEEFISLLHEVEKKQTYKVIKNIFEPLVSSDFAKEEYTSIVDHRFTDVKRNKMLKFVLWYDNEWGYASKVIEIVNKL